MSQIVFGMAMQLIYVYMCGHLSMLKFMWRWISLLLFRLFHVGHQATGVAAIVE